MSGIPSEFQEPAYRARRLQNWVLVGCLYSLFYMTRYNFSAMGASLQDVFGWTKGDLGLFELVLPLVYGISVVINAPIVDKLGGRKAFLIGAVGVVIASLAFGAFDFVLIQAAQWVGTGEARTMLAPAQLAGGQTPSDLAFWMAMVWGVNAYFQSFGALAIVKINAQWFHIRERGTFSAIFGVLIRLGLILGNSIAPLFANLLGWKYAFWLPAGFVGLFFFLNLFFVVETPEDAGFDTRDTGDAVHADAGGRVTVLGVLQKIVTSRLMWTIAISSMMVGMVRRSVLDGAWSSLYFRDVHGITKSDAMFHVSYWAVAFLGIIGGFVFGGMSDRIFGSRRAPVVVIGFSGMILALLVFVGSDAMGLGGVGAAASFAILSFFVNGAHGMIGGAASMDFGGRKGAATAAGLFDGMQYLAAALTGPAVAWITSQESWPVWQVWKLWALPFAIVGAIAMATLWNVLPKGRGGH
jgi:OPA family glycerol-3-phosphate transporter-like MFS transporter